MPAPSAEVIVPEVLNDEHAVVVRHDDALTEFANPMQGIARAQVIANQLADIIKSRKLSVSISGREHIRVEGWMTLGAMCGVTASTIETKQDEEGFWARCQVIRLANGAVIGGAEARCDWSEKNWSNRDTHALLSMAQTRAASKALAQVLRWIPILAGYEGTPYEEMPSDSGARGGATREVRGRQASGDYEAKPSRAPVSDDLSWLDETVGGKKYAGKTWRHLAEGSYMGERHQYVQWIVEKADRMTPETKRRAKVLLDGYEAAHNASNPAADAAPADPAWEVENG